MRTFNSIVLALVLVSFTCLACGAGAGQLRTTVIEQHLTQKGGDARITVNGEVVEPDAVDATDAPDAIDATTDTATDGEITVTDASPDTVLLPGATVHHVVTTDGPARVELDTFVPFPDKPAGHEWWKSPKFVVPMVILGVLVGAGATAAGVCLGKPGLCKGTVHTR